ncbi:MAG: transglutaminase family protein [Nibricoccus sp.]
MRRIGHRKIFYLFMRFRIEHRTSYRYAGTASESFMEARLTPINDEQQRLISRRLTTTPGCNIHTYTDYFGNTVETFSIVHRHSALVLVSESEVETLPIAPPKVALDISVSEARQIFRSERLHLYEFLRPSPAIELTPEVNQLANQFFKPRDPLGPSLLKLNAWIKENFKYIPGSTRIDTPVSTVLKSRAGVCQDFAQLMIAVLRSAEIPARYITGYIETDSQRDASKGGVDVALIGASESHAWVDVRLPGGFWWPLDPTNNCVAGERHVKVSTGRDYQDGTPTRGVFKGTYTEWLNVGVVMQRIQDAPRGA